MAIISYEVVTVILRRSDRPSALISCGHSVLNDFQNIVQDLAGESETAAVAPGVALRIEVSVHA